MKQLPVIPGSSPLKSNGTKASLGGSINSTRQRNQANDNTRAGKINGNDDPEKMAEERKLQELITGGTRPDSPWKMHVENRKSRPNWMMRYSSSITESNIVEPPTSSYSLRELRNQRERERIQIELVTKMLPVSPRKFPELKMEQLHAFKDEMYQSKYCYRCFTTVPIGSELVECCSCTVVAHLGCIPEKGNYLVRSETSCAFDEFFSRSFSQSLDDLFSSSSDNTKNRGIAPHQPIRNRRQSLSKQMNVLSKKVDQLSVECARPNLNENHNNKTITGSEYLTPDAAMLIQEETKRREDNITAKDIKWYCPFCEHEVRASNDYNRQKHLVIFKKILRLTAVVRIQTVYRMRQARRRFERALRGITSMQRYFRMRVFAKQKELERYNKRYPLRIRIHDIQLFIKDQGLLSMLDDESILASGGPNILPQSEFDDVSPSDGVFFGANSEGYSESNEEGTVGLLKPTSWPPPPLDEKLPPYETHTIGDFLSLTYDKLFGVQKVPEWTVPDSDQPLIQLLSKGHSDNPTYAKTYSSIQAIPKGNLILTVSIHEMIDDSLQDLAGKRHQQNYRFDLPMKEVGRSVRVKPALLQKLGYNISSMDRQTLENISHQYRLANFSVQRPYIMIPHLMAHAQVTFTLSQILEWPKSVAIGRITQQLKTVIKRNRCTALRRTFNLNVGYGDVPVPDGGGKLNIVPKTQLSHQRAVPSYAQSKSAPRVAKARAAALSNTLPKASTTTASPNKLVKSSSTSNASPSISSKTLLPQISSPSGHGSMSASNHDIKKIDAQNEIGAQSDGESPRRSPRRHKKKDRKNEKEPDSVNGIAHHGFDGGLLTFSLISMGLSEWNEFGWLMQLNQEFVTATKKKIWCVLSDRVLFCYTIDKDVAKIRIQLDISTSHVTLLADEVIRISSNMGDIIFLHCLTLRDHEKWFKKLYMESASSVVTPYATYIRRKGAHNSSFANFDPSIIEKTKAEANRLHSGFLSSIDKDNLEEGVAAESNISTAQHQISRLEDEVDGVIRQQRHQSIWDAAGVVPLGKLKPIPKVPVLTAIPKTADEPKFDKVSSRGIIGGPNIKGFGHSARRAAKRAGNSREETKDGRNTSNRQNTSRSSKDKRGQRSNIHKSASNGGEDATNDPVKELGAQIDDDNDSDGPDASEMETMKTLLASRSWSMADEADADAPGIVLTGRRKTGSIRRSISTAVSNKVRANSMMLDGVAEGHEVNTSLLSGMDDMDDDDVDDDATPKRRVSGSTTRGLMDLLTSSILQTVRVQQRM